MDARWKASRRRTLELLPKNPIRRTTESRITSLPLHLDGILITTFNARLAQFGLKE